MRTRSVVAHALTISGLVLLCSGCGTTDASGDAAAGDAELDGEDSQEEVDEYTGSECIWPDEEICEPDCAGKECGHDGCGGACGQCPLDATKTCSPDTWTCVDVGDSKDCGDKVCGPSMMPGLDCGTCKYGTCAADQLSCECTPACEGRFCGPDGCGGSCPGSCACDDHNDICSADGQCTCVTFGKASQLNALYIPAAPESTGAEAADFPNVAGAVCLDLNGDGTIDNGLGALLETLAGFGVDANGELEKMFDEGTLVLLLDLGADPEAAPFDLKGYLGQPGAEAGEYLIEPTSFVEGEPMIHVAGAEVVAGKLELGPITFPLGALLAGFLAGAGVPPLDLTLDKVQLVGTLDGVLSADGVALKDGTLAGVVFKADLDKALYLARKWCTEDPEAPADVCGYLQMADMSLIETFLSWDQEIADCGKKLQVYDANDPMIVIGEEDDCQAVSACLFWGSEKARITGLAPAATE